MKYLRLFYLLIILVELISCTNQDETNNFVSKDIFYEVLDSLEDSHGLKNKLITIGRYESDEVIEFIKEGLASEFGRADSGPDILIKDLINVIGDSTYIDFSDEGKHYNIEWGDTGKKTLKHKYSNQNCILYISEPVYTSNRKMGCFYISFGAIDSPAGYIVFIGRATGNWEVVTIIRNWG
jgi:hypothetical protein